jgi:hypothetical protein
MKSITLQVRFLDDRRKFRGRQQFSFCGRRGFIYYLGRNTVLRLPEVISPNSGWIAHAGMPVIVGIQSRLWRGHPLRPVVPEVVRLPGSPDFTFVSGATNWKTFRIRLLGNLHCTPVIAPASAFPEGKACQTVIAGGSIAGRDQCRVICN